MFQARSPHPGVGDPKSEVNERPVREMVSADSPQFSDPQVSLPHPCSGKAVTVPTVDVVESPVNETVIVSDCQELAPQTLVPQVAAIRKSSLR